MDEIKAAGLGGSKARSTVLFSKTYISSTLLTFSEWNHL